MHDHFIDSISDAFGLIRKMPSRPLLSLNHSLHTLSSIHKPVLVIDSHHSTAKDALVLHGFSGDL